MFDCLLFVVLFPIQLLLELAFEDDVCVEILKPDLLDVELY